LFNKLQIPTKGVKKTKTGFSTDSSVLERLAGKHPLVDALLEYRGLHKLKSTYVDSLPTQVHPATGRIHTKLNQTIAATGRLSSSEPNLQNIPIQTAEGRKIRNAFVAPPGKVLISADYSQIELRVLAHLSGDTALIKAFESGVDIHAGTAREIFGLGPIETVTPEQRRVGKTINFGVVYGMGAFRLARDLEISVPTASKYIQSYFERFPGVRSFFEKLEAQAEREGQVRTLYGRRRVLKDIEQGERDQGFVMRAALNAPIQGSAADIIKLAMISLEKKLETYGDRCRMILQIHDELLFECNEDIVESVVPMLRSEMEQVLTLSVPLKVEAGWGRDWESAH
jgi:DNA polymerase-1